MNVLLFGLLRLDFSVKVCDVPVCLIYDILFCLKKYYCCTPDMLQTHLCPCFIFQHCISVISVICVMYCLLLSGILKQLF